MNRTMLRKAGFVAVVSLLTAVSLNTLARRVPLVAQVRDIVQSGL